MITDLKDFGLAGLSLIIMGGIVRLIMRRHAEPGGRLRALEVKLEKTSEGVIKAEAHIVDLETLIETRSSALDEKMEIVLAEMKESREKAAAMHRENSDALHELTNAFNEAYRLMVERLTRVETNSTNLKEAFDREFPRRGRAGV